MFEVEKEVAGVELSKQNDFLIFANVDQTFQGDFQTIAQSENKHSAHACLRVECLSRPKQDV